VRGTVAKRFRKEVYGDDSTKVKKYGGVNHKKEKTMKGKDGKPQIYIYNVTTIICVDKRGMYLQLKKAFMKGLIV
jgi:hypothetical protein